MFRKIQTISIVLPQTIASFTKGEHIYKTVDEKRVKTEKTVKKIVVRGKKVIIKISDGEDLEYNGLPYII